MVLSLKQRAILYSLYKQYLKTNKIETFVPTKGITTNTMSALLKTGYIETDRAINKVPSNMRITQAGIDSMKLHTSLVHNTIAAILKRNKAKLYKLSYVDEKLEALVSYLGKPIDVVSIEYGIVNIGDMEFYEVYTTAEAYLLGITPHNSKKYYIERVKFS
jgi:predicted transcriptional regulator with HTH domain